MVEKDKYKRRASIHREWVETLDDALFGQINDGSTICVWTGKGGVKDYIKALNKEFNVKNPDTVTFKQMLAVFRNGWVKRVSRGLYQIN